MIQVSKRHTEQKRHVLQQDALLVTRQVFSKMLCKFQANLLSKLKYGSVQVSISYLCDDYIINQAPPNLTRHVIAAFHLRLANNYFHYHLPGEC